MDHEIHPLPALQEVVGSSSVTHIGHAGTTLLVRFKNGRTYKYSGVPASLFSVIMAADSVGSALSREVVKHPDLYPFVEV